MDPVTLGIIAGGTTLASAGNKFFQARKMSKLADEIEPGSRPVRSTPEGVLQAVGLAERMASQGITDAEENAFTEDINQSQATTINAARSRRGGILGAEIAEAARRRSRRDILVEKARRRQENQARLMSQYNILGAEQDKNFQWNEAMPYTENLNYARALRGAGMQTMNNAFDTLSGNATTLAAGYMQGQNPTTTTGG